jgi:hypothetical protein
LKEKEAVSPTSMTPPCGLDAILMIPIRPKEAARRVCFMSVLFLRLLRLDQDLLCR